MRGMDSKRSLLALKVANAVRRHLEGATDIRELKRLPAGATQETSSFEAVFGGSDACTRRLILRRRPDGGGPPEDGNMQRSSLGIEAQILVVAREHGVPVPKVEFILEGEDDLGQGYVMEFIEGETIPRKILRDDVYAEARPRLARQCGEVLAKIHAVDPDLLPDLPRLRPKDQVDRQRESLVALARPNPVLELTIGWLQGNLPAEGEPHLVHGDFRNGNLIVGAEGLRSVLDWELAKIGNPVEDIGWVCANVWRFGEIDHHVGGFGSLEELLAGYASAGGKPIDPEEVRWWEVLASVKWAMACMAMHVVFSSGLDRTVERAAIGRRLSENEIDLLNLLAPRK